MRFGCCGGPDQIGVLAEAGYDYCELPARAVLPFEDDATADPELHALEGMALRAEAFNQLVPAELPLVGPALDLPAVQTYLRRAFGRMVGIGGEIAVLGSGAARRIPDGMPREQGLAQLAEVLAMARDEAERAGIMLVLEHLHATECNVFTTVAECVVFIKRYDLAGLYVLADLYHLEQEREPFLTVALAGPLLVHVHVAGRGRSAPSAADCDYTGFMNALHAAGYDRRISAECRWENLAGQSAQALAFMRSQWADAVRTGASRECRPLA